jgi:hypothetical protein
MLKFFRCPSPDGSGNPFAFFFKKGKDCNVQRELAPKKISHLVLRRRYLCR